MSSRTHVAHHYHWGALQLTQATKRLSTNFGEAKGYDIGPEGSFQDLTRFLIAAAYSHAMHKGRVQTTKPTDQVDWDSHRFNPGEIIPSNDICRKSAAAHTRRRRPSQAVVCVSICASLLLAVLLAVLLTGTSVSG